MLFTKFKTSYKFSNIIFGGKIILANESIKNCQITITNVAVTFI